MSSKKENTLKIVFQTNGFQYVSKIENKTKTDFLKINSDTEQEFLNRIEFHLSNNKDLNKEFNQVSVYIQHTKYSAVPTELFDEQLTENYLELTTELSNNESIRYNFDLEKKIVFVFSLSEKLETLLEKKYKRINFFHSTFQVLQNLEIKKLPTELHLYFHNESIDYYLFKDGNLINIHHSINKLIPNLKEKVKEIVEINNLNINDLNIFHYQSESSSFIEILSPTVKGISFVKKSILI